MTDASTETSSLLGLADIPDDPLIVRPWVESYVRLGCLLRQYLPKLDARQLVVAISVPRRDYVAALIGAGWMLSAAPPVLDPPLAVFEASDRATCLRAVTDKLIVTGPFVKLEPNAAGPRVFTGGKRLPADRYRAVTVLDRCVEPICTDVPDAGFLAELTDASTTWLDRLAFPPMDLALVGTGKWLREDLRAVVGNGAVRSSVRTELGTYVLPDHPHAATWSTPVMPAARLGEGEALPETCSAVILDRYGAIKYLNDMTVPLVVCIVDRSVADESASELIVEARHSNSHPVSMRDDIRWDPPLAVEVLAFTVAL